MTCRRQWTWPVSRCHPRGYSRNEKRDQLVTVMSNVNLRDAFEPLLLVAVLSH